LRPKLEALLAEVDSSHSSHLQQLAKQAQSLISNTTMPDDIQRAIADAYHHLSSKDIFVAVRASVPDSEALDVAVPHQAMLNVYSAKAVVAQVQAMWASLFTSKSLYARAERGAGQLSSGMAVIVQRMVESESSGIVFSVYPMVQNNHTVSIEAIWGLGEPMISGELTPDHYEVDRREWTIGRKDIVRQEWQMTRQETKQDQAKEGNLKLPV
jgi:pyruvate,water dikinase